MALPNDFKTSEPLNPFVFDVVIKDLNVNYDLNVTFNDGKSYPKRPGQTYINISVEIIDGEYKGQTFVQKNVNTGIYKSAKGKSQMYVLLEKAGVPTDKLDAIAEQKVNINLNDLINKTVTQVAKKASPEAGGNFYLELRDPEVLAKKNEGRNAQADEDAILGKNNTPFEGPDNSKQVEDILGGNTQQQAAPSTSNTLFDK